MFDTAAFERNGYAVLNRVYDERTIQSLQQQWSELMRESNRDAAILSGGTGGVYGARNVLKMWPDVIHLITDSTLKTILSMILGPDAGVVRGLLFDKPPGQSWALPMHRDLTIAVKKHGAIGTFTKPTSKAGVPHVEAPIELLDRMVTVRISLDETTDENGPLKLIPGSHRGDNTSPMSILGNAGDVLLMRPRILHGSGKSAERTNRHRRVIHLECAATSELPDGYEWNEFISLA